MTSLFIKRLIFGSTLAGLSALGTTAMAATVFLDQTAFLSQAGTLNYTSLEEQTVTGTFSSTVDVGPFSVTSPRALLRVAQRGLSGSHATDGTKFLRSRGGQQHTFTFHDPINAIGFYMTDAFNWAAGTLTYTTSSGTSGTTSFGRLAEANSQYWSLITEELFTSLTIRSSIIDGLGFDAFSFGVVNLAGIELGPVQDDFSHGGPLNGSDSSAELVTTPVPTPGAGIAGLVLLGLLAARHRRRRY